MRRILFVSNGHGEVAIAHRIARALRELDWEPSGLDHLALVGRGGAGEELELVGPRRSMPSGGLVAMGNVRAIAGDVAAGFARLLAQQVAFVRREGGRYDAVIAVGDVYALGFALMAGAARSPIFVGTAKSVYVAPYGPFERRLLRGAARVFVRDEPTAARLRGQHVRAEAPGNVIVDLACDAGGGRAARSEGTQAEASGEITIGVLPGSRESAYLDGLRLARVVRALGERIARPVHARFSVAPALCAERFASILTLDGWTPSSAAATAAQPFALESGRTRLAGWCGSVGEILRTSRLVAGQAGTANEEAAALGVPVVALAAPTPDGRREGWYRMRQRRLLGEALAVVPSDPVAAAAEIAALLGDTAKLRSMSEAGQARMGPPGGAAAIARAIAAHLDERLP